MVSMPEDTRAVVPRRYNVGGKTRGDHAPRRPQLQIHDPEAKDNPPRRYAIGPQSFAGAKRVGWWEVLKNMRDFEEIDVPFPPTTERNNTAVNESPADACYVHAIAVNRIPVTDGLNLDDPTVRRAKVGTSRYWLVAAAHALEKRFRIPASPTDMEHGASLSLIGWRLKFADEMHGAVEAVLQTHTVARAPFMQSSLRGFLASAEA